MKPTTVRQTAFSSTIYLKDQLRSRRFWASLSLTIAVLLLVEGGRLFGLSIPIPFLLLFAAMVTAASNGGLLAGLIAATLASAYIIYAATIGFGPATLTGNIFAILLGVGLFYWVVYKLGRLRDHNHELNNSLMANNQQLEATIEKRTLALKQANILLNEQMETQQDIAATLRVSEGQLNAILNSNIDLICRYRIDTTLTFVNDTYCRYFGKSREDLVGKSFLYLSDEGEYENIVERIADLVQTRQPRVIEVSGRSADGQLRWLQWVDQIVTTSDGEVLIQAVGRDITEQRRYQQELMQHERLAAVGQLSAGVAHDFNNILAVISIYAQLLLRNEPISDEGRRRLETISEQIQHATGLTNQILDFSRRSVTEKQAIDIVRPLQETITLLKRTFPDNIAIDCELPTIPYKVFADPTRLQQAFLNLALNARDAMPNGGVLKIRVAAAEAQEAVSTHLDDAVAPQWVAISFSDQGSGIHEDVLPKIFEPFYTTKGPQQGTGLGLAQVNGIVKQHKGNLTVETKLDEGSKFILYLPLPADDETAIVLPPQEMRISPGKGELILLVEDNLLLLEALTHGLRSINYQVAKAENGEAALQMLRAQREEISLIISDVVMPNMGGADMIRQMRQLGIQLPVLIVSGHPLADDLEELTLQANIFSLAKPFSLEMLSATITNIIHK